MQLYAYDQGNLIFVDTAIPSKYYTCPECQQTLCVRSGLHRRKHFYHLKTSKNCRQSQKSLVHLNIQYTLLSKLPDGEGKLEKYFPEIRRIADVAWEKKKIVFEVQCSPISLSELKNRILDYQKIGFHVIWILHEKTFNQKRLHPVEVFLKNTTFFYTSIYQEGMGIIYDQFSIDRHHQRLYRDAPYPVTINKVKPLPDILRKEALPSFLKKRLHTTPIYFKGDIFDRIQTLQEETARLITIEDHFLHPCFLYKRSFLKSPHFLYKLALFSLLKKCAKKSL